MRVSPLLSVESNARPRRGSADRYTPGTVTRPADSTPKNTYAQHKASKRGESSHAQLDETSTIQVVGKRFLYAVPAGHTRSPMGAVLKSIEDRRTIRKFRPDPVEDEKIKAILSAGRWAPSFLNLQPWKFIVVKDKTIKKQIGETLNLPFLLTDYRGTTAYDFIAEVPAVIVVCVDAQKDKLHYVEAGAIASQNMSLAAHSLGLGSYWIGVFNHGYIEDGIKKILQVPNEFRIISLLPLGFPDERPTRTRDNLEDLVFYEKFGSSGKHEEPVHS